MNALQTHEAHRPLGYGAKPHVDGPKPSKLTPHEGAGTAQPIPALGGSAIDAGDMLRTIKAQAARLEKPLLFGLETKEFPMKSTPCVPIHRIK